jgi:exopolyphosphatase/guanosine-5'-triphosphate,3'-diphosphate pyrophosphatase
MTAAAAGGRIVTTTGDRPPMAEEGAPAAREAEGDRESAVAAGDPLRMPDKPAGGGQRHKARKSRRRRRRGPVYAPGAGPRAPHADAADALQGQPPPAATGPAPSGPFYAALDLGTNNCRLLVATPRDHGFRVVDAFSRIVRLGEGIGQTGRLSEAAMDRAVEALRICAGKLTDRQVRRARLIATEACRAAANGAEFVARVHAETGLLLEIVSQETEAKLAVAGCASLVDSRSNGVILFDIGGGSSEIVWIDLAGTSDGRRRRMADRVRSWMSLPLGVVNVSERHGGRHVGPEVFAAMVDEVAGKLDDFPEVAALDDAVVAGGVHMLGTSGTVTTLAGVHLELPRYDRRKVDGVWLTGLEVETLVARLAAMDYEARVANPCIGRDRADLVLAGCAILEAMRRRWPVDRLRVADRGLREGVLVEMMAEDGVWRGRARKPAGARP